MKKISFLSGVLLMGLAGPSFASDPVITLSNTTVDVTLSDQTNGFTTNPTNANLQIEFIQDPPNGVAAVYGWVSSGPQIFVPKATYAGEWIVNKVDYYTDEGTVVYSRNHNADWGELPMTDAMAALSFNVTNSDPDTVPPEVATFDIDLGQLTKSEDGAWLYAPCTITATDDKSGFGGLQGSYVGSGDPLSSVFISISKDDRIGSSDVYQGYATFGNSIPGEIFDLNDLNEIYIRDNAGNAIVYSNIYYSRTINNYTIVVTDTIPQIYNVEIQLPDNFDDIPVRIFSSSSSSSSINAAVESVKSSKKGKKGKDSAKNDNSSKKKSSSAKKSSSTKKSPAKKSKGGKKSKK